VSLQVSVDPNPEFLKPLLPDRWAAAHLEHVLSRRVEESREKAKRRDERRAMRRKRFKSNLAGREFHLLRPTAG
jgi:hypothetical protein